MKKGALEVILVLFTCWVLFVGIEGLRLIGSTNPEKRPFIVLDTTQTTGEIIEYNSLTFSQTYHITNKNRFVYGEFKVCGIRIARWEN